MTNTTANPKRIRVVFSQSTPLLKVLVALLLTFSLMALGALTWVKLSVQQQTEDLRAESVAIARENQKLEKRLEDPDSNNTIREIAQEELGLADPSTLIIQPN